MELPAVAGVWGALHSDALELVSARNGTSAQGLAMAAKKAQKAGVISPQMGRKVRQLETAAAWPRHASQQRSAESLMQLQEDFDGMGKFDKAAAAAASGHETGVGWERWTGPRGVPPTLTLSVGTDTYSQCPTLANCFITD